MGPLSKAEMMLSGIFIVAFVLWAATTYTKLDATIVALFAVSLMLAVNIVNWNDVIENKGAWDTLFWMGTLIGLANFLVKFGFIAWFSKSVSAGLVGIPTFQAFMLITVIYMYSHCGFASMVPTSWPCLPLWPPWPSLRACRLMWPPFLLHILCTCWPAGASSPWLKKQLAKQQAEAG